MKLKLKLILFFAVFGLLISCKEKPKKSEMNTAEIEQESQQLQAFIDKVYQEDFYILEETDGDNMLAEDGNLLASEAEDIVLETGEHILQESVSEGLRIIDISNTYPNRLISNLERELGRRTNFNHSTVVQTG